MRTRRRYISDSARAHLAAAANDTALAVFKRHMNIARDSTLLSGNADSGTRKHQQLICTLDTILLTLGRYLTTMDKCGVLNLRQWQKNLLHVCRRRLLADNVPVPDEMDLECADRIVKRLSEMHSDRNTAASSAATKAKGKVL
jgi:hypothetical protein